MLNIFLELDGKWRQKNWGDTAVSFCIIIYQNIGSF